MTRLQDFDVDTVLSTLHGISSSHSEDSPESESLRVAATALIYLRETQKLDDYRAFLHKFTTPAVDAILIAQAFSTQDEANAWLASGAARDGDLVSIEGQGFQVIPQRSGVGFRFLRTPLPAELMKKFPTS